MRVGKWLAGWITILLALASAIAGQKAKQVAGDTQLRVDLIGRRDLSPPPQGAFDACVDGPDVFLADRSAGRIRRYSRETGQLRADIGKIGRTPGEFVKPIHVFPTANGFAVYNWIQPGRHGIVMFDRDWKFVREVVTGESLRRSIAPIICPHWYKERFLMVAYDRGFTQPTPPAGALLFSLDIAGNAQMVMTAASDEEATHMGRALSETMGGLATLPDGGWVAVLPGSYEFLRFDAGDRPVKRWRGDRAKFVAPDWNAKYPNTQAGMWRWIRTLTFVSGPVVVTPRLVGVIVAPAEANAAGRSVWFEVYDIDSGVLTTRVRLPLSPTITATEVLAHEGSGRNLCLLVREESDQHNTAVASYEFAIIPPVREAK